MTPRTRRLLWLAGWILAASLIWLLARGLDSAAISAALKRADWRFLVLAMLTYALLQPVGALQWRALVPKGSPIPGRRLLTLFSLTSLANNTTPSIVGHATGAALLAAEPGVGPAAAVSIIAMDQLAVGVSKLVVLLAAVSVLDAPGWLRTGSLSLLAVVVVLGATLAFASRRAATLDALREPRRLAAAIGFALLARTLEGVAIVAVQRAVGADLGGTGALAVLAATSLATVIPFSPAGLGTYEAGVYGAYRVLGHAPEVALSAAVLQHACLLVPAVGIGYITLTVRRRV